MRRLVLPALALLFSLASTAWAGTIALVLSENSGPYAEFAKTFDASLQNTTWKIISTTLDDNASADLIITVGSDAFKQALSKPNATPILATLLPRQSYEKSLSEFSKTRHRVSAIYLDQPAARQAVFLRRILPEHPRIGMLFSPETRPLNNLYHQALKAQKLSLDSEDSDTPNTLLPAIKNLLPRVDVLLATPDSTIYNRDNIKAILVSSYRHQRPVVAYSAGFVSAGAVAAIFSTPSQIGQQAAELIVRVGTALPAPLAPTLFTIRINYNVAKALGIQIPDEAAIHRAMLTEQESR